jgi:hypothetical protein
MVHTEIVEPEAEKMRESGHGDLAETAVAGKSSMAGMTNGHYIQTSYSDTVARSFLDTKGEFMDKKIARGKLRVDTPEEGGRSELE